MVRQPARYAADDANVNQALDYYYPEPWSTRTSTDLDLVPKTPMLLGVKLNPGLKDFLASDVMSISKSYSAYFIPDSSEAELIALGITPANQKDYKYHVVENDSIELVPWSPVSRMAQDHGAKRPYAFLGKYRAPGRQIMIEVVNTKDYHIRDGVIFDWRTDYMPRITQMTIMKPNNNYFNVNYRKLNGGFATRFDSLTGLPLNLKFPVDTVEMVMLNFKRHETITYSIYLVKNTGGKTDTVTVEFFLTGNNFVFESKWFDKPGKYELLIHQAIDPSQWKGRDILRLPFEVLPPPAIEKKVSLKQLLPYILGAIAFIGLAFFAYYRYNKRRLKHAAAKSEAVSLQLRSIRSQLNPHFMFNALAAIQGLMNKNDTAGANHYLAKFADLTRQVLQSGEEEMISLEDELRILDDYLQMEQLRFGFSYEISVDPAINQANTEIPVMLLQPFVENAVKHGVGTLQQQGKIEVSVQQHDQRLVLTVKDNGRGFDRNGAATAGTGFGLRLSGQRIVLLNQKYRAPRVSLDINSGTAGTIAKVELHQWI